MIALDTNVLVRFLVEDDEAQSERARALLQQAVDTGVPCHVSDIVVCEVVWVLQSSYRVRKAEVTEILHRLIQTRSLSFSNPDRIDRALDAFRSGKGDFADYLIRERARAAGCEAVATFDQALLSEPGFFRP